MELSLKPKNIIEGKNGEGKSTIRDAIIFCFYGRTSEGSLTESSKYILDGETKATVEVEFEKNGETFIIRRERTEKNTRITYVDGSQSDDDSVITQRELDSIVPDYQLMQIVFNIGYFMKLSDKEKRDFMLRLTKNIDRKKIFLDIVGFEKADLIEMYRLNFDDIAYTHKNLLRLNRENNEELARNKAIISDSRPITIPEYTVRSAREGLIAMKLLRQELMDIKYRWEKYERYLENVKLVTDANEINKLKIDGLKIENISKPSDEKLNKLIQQKNECLSTIQIPEGRCPTCLQEIGDEHKAKVSKANAIRTENLKRISAALETEQSSFRSATDAYEENEAKKRKKEILENSFQTIAVVNAPQEKIQEFDEEKERALESQERLFQQESANIHLLTAQEERRKEKIGQLVEANKEIVKDINRIDFLLPVFSPSGITAEEMKIKLAPVLEKMREFIPTIRIETIENLKNGLDTKEVFNIFVDEIEYSKLSTGQKMKVDCALSQLIDHMSNYQIGCYFLDNSESVDEIPPIKEQYFIAKVINQPLTIK